MIYTNFFRIFASVLAITIAPASFADTESLPLREAVQLMNGDQSRLASLESCATENHMCALLVASHLRERSKHEAAAEYLRQALGLGYRRAATTLAFMHTENERHIEGWAWSYLAYALDDPDETLPEEDLQKLFSVRLLATNQQALDEKGLAAAKRRAEELMTQWWDELKSSPQPAARADAPETPLVEAKPATRVPPEYPRRLARIGYEGFALVYFEVNRRGQVIDAVAVDFSHPEFGKATVDVVEQWRFSINAPDDRKRYPSTQMIEYRLDDA